MDIRKKTVKATLRDEEIKNYRGRSCSYIGIRRL